MTTTLTVLLAGVVSAGAVPFTPLTQIRSTDANALVYAGQNEIDIQSAAASDFLPFVSHISASAVGSDGAASANGYAEALQNSTIGGNQITVSLAASVDIQAVPDLDNGLGAYAQAEASSVFLLTFSVSEPAAFTLSGFRTGGGDLVLDGPSGPFFLDSGGGAFSFGGLLQPGDYTFVAGAGAVGFTEDGQIVDSSTLEARLVFVPDSGMGVGLTALLLFGLTSRRRPRLPA